MRKVIVLLYLVALTVTTDSASASQVHFLPLEKSAKDLNAVFLVKIDKVKRWDTYRKLKDGKQGPANTYNVEYKAKLLKTLMGAWAGKGDQLTIKHTIVNPVVYDKDGKELFAKSMQRPGTGLEHSMEKGKTYVVCTWQRAPKSPFYVPYADAAEKADHIIRTIRHVKEIVPMAKALKTDQQSFALHVLYEGDEDKPYYRMHIYGGQAPPKKWPPFHRVVSKLTKKEFTGLIDHLSDTGLLERRLPENAKLPEPVAPYYQLRVSNRKLKAPLTIILGWDLKMYKDLEGLGKALNKDGQEKMATLLGRLSGHKREWEKAKK